MVGETVSTVAVVRFKEVGIVYIEFIITES